MKVTAKRRQQALASMGAELAPGRQAAMAERTAMQAVIEIDLNYIEIAKNVRTVYNEDSINELADSIKSHGVKQPITVYENPENMGHYFIKWGHRRFLASKKAEKRTIPSFVSTVIPDETSRLEDQLIENINREDLPDLDIEGAIAALVGDSPERGRLTDVAARIGKPKIYVIRALDAWHIRSAVNEKVRAYLVEWGSRPIYDLFHTLPAQEDFAVAVGAFETLIAQKAGWPSKEEEAAAAAVAAKKAEELKNAAPEPVSDLGGTTAKPSSEAHPAEDEVSIAKKAEGDGKAEPSVIQRATAIRATPPAGDEAKGDGRASLPNMPAFDEGDRKSSPPSPLKFSDTPPLIEWQCKVLLAQNKHPTFKVKSVRADFKDIPERAKALFNKAFTLIDEAYASR
jgi:ParB/RepB/Spo0J family partition protein